MTFETNWRNLKTRHELIKAGKLTETHKEKLPLTDNFKMWANKNWNAVIHKLDCQPELELADPCSDKDYINFVLGKSNKHLDGIFPISEELTEMAKGIENQVREEILADLDGCIVCSAPTKENTNHCEVCELEILEKGLFPNGATLQDSIFLRLENSSPYAEQSEATKQSLKKKAVRDRNKTLKEIGENRAFTEYEGEEEILAQMPVENIPIQILNSIINFDKIDQRIREWNPRVLQWDNPEATADEFGNPINHEYTVEPEIIDPASRKTVSDVPELNDHYVGKNEHGEDVYRDFDNDGFYLPQGNPNNASDTREDIDLTDHTEYREQDWQSEDFIDDHNIVPCFAEQIVSETPTIIETEYKREDGLVYVVEHIEWETETHENAESPITTEDDQDWLEDARNWLTRGKLLAETDDEVIAGEIMLAYPVSEGFLQYVKEKEISWDTANERLSQLIEDRSEVQWV